jgi:hypothetical protein
LGTILGAVALSTVASGSAVAAPRQRVQCNGVVDAADYVVWRKTLGGGSIMAEWSNGGFANLTCPDAPGLNGPHPIRQHVQGVIQANATSCRMQGRQTTNILIGLLLPAVQKFNGEVSGMGPRTGNTCTLNLQLVDRTPGGGTMLMSGQLVFDAEAGTIRPAGPLSISFNFDKIE